MKASNGMRSITRLLAPAARLSNTVTENVGRVRYHDRPARQCSEPVPCVQNPMAVLKRAVNNRQIPWDKDDNKLMAWKEARTGFPWIDAAMTQLKDEGCVPRFQARNGTTAHSNSSSIR